MTGITARPTAVTSAPPASLLTVTKEPMINGGQQ